VGCHNLVAVSALVLAVVLYTVKVLIWVMQQLWRCEFGKLPLKSTRVTQLAVLWMSVLLVYDVVILF
jgi:hypothetical protein